MTTQDDVLVKNNPAKEAGHVISLEYVTLES